MNKQLDPNVPVIALAWVVAACFIIFRVTGCAMQNGSTDPFYNRTPVATPKK